MAKLHPRLAGIVHLSGLSVDFLLPSHRYDHDYSIVYDLAKVKLVTNLCAKHIIKFMNHRAAGVAIYQQEPDEPYEKALKDLTSLKFLETNSLPYPGIERELHMLPLA